MNCSANFEVVSLLTLQNYVRINFPKNILMCLLVPSILESFKDIFMFEKQSIYIVRLSP